MQNRYLIRYQMAEEYKADGVSVVETVLPCTVKTGFRELQKEQEVCC